jgi:hypothetical protein
VGGIATFRSVAVSDNGVNGPKLIAPFAVATKRLITEPWVNLIPLTVKLLPATTVFGIETIKGPVEVGVGVGVLVGVLEAVGVAVSVAVGLGEAV